MPEALEVERFHLLESLLGRPPIESNTIGGDKHATAISTEPAVHEYSSPRPSAYQSEKLSNLFIPRRRPAVARYVDETYAEGLGMFTFFFHSAAPFAPKVDNGVNAELLQVFEAFFFRLRAAVKKIIYLASIRNTGNIDFLCESNLLRRRDGSVVVGTTGTEHRQPQHQLPIEPVRMHYSLDANPAHRIHR